MKNKLVFASGMAAGFVFGARAGRGSYEKIKSKAMEVWNSPSVQSTVSSTTETLKTKTPSRESLPGVLRRAGGRRPSTQNSPRYDGTPPAVVPAPGETEPGGLA